MTLYRAPTAEELVKFLLRVEVLPNGCWKWLGGKSHNYGCFYWNGVAWKAHRVAYLWMTGKVAEELDHYVCDYKLCANPHHVKDGTHQENLARTRSDYCRRGHLRTEANTYRYFGESRCRDCYKEWTKNRRLLGDI